MAKNERDRMNEAIIGWREKRDSALRELGRSASVATVALENLRLAIPTEDVRGIRQEATDAIDRAMR